MLAAAPSRGDRLPERLPDLEAGQPDRFLALDIDPVDAGAARAVAAELHQSLDRLVSAFEDGLDGAVGAVPNVTGDTDREGAAPSGLAEEDPLDVTLDDNAAPLHGSRLVAGPETDDLLASII